MLFYEYFVKCVVSGILGNNVTFCVRKQRLMFLKDFFQLYISINLHWICIKRQQPKSRRLKKIPLLLFLKICFKTVLGRNDYYSWEVSLNPWNNLLYTPAYQWWRLFRLKLKSWNELLYFLNFSQTVVHQNEPWPMMIVPFKSEVQSCKMSIFLHRSFLSN